MKNFDEELRSLLEDSMHNQMEMLGRIDAFKRKYVNLIDIKLSSILEFTKGFICEKNNCIDQAINHYNQVMDNISLVEVSTVMNTLLGLQRCARFKNLEEEAKRYEEQISYIKTNGKIPN